MAKFTKQEKQKLIEKIREANADKHDKIMDNIKYGTEDESIILLIERVIKQWNKKKSRASRL